MDIPVFLICGFIESGKTTFLTETMNDPEFSKGERTLLIACEEGIEEYDIKELKKKNVSVVTIEEEEEVNNDFLRKCQAKYRPERVLIEYNGTWNKDAVFQMQLPKKWVIAQVITTVDATTFTNYYANMKAMMSANITNTDLVIFNRCTENTDKKAFRKSIKLLNRQTAIIYESVDGSIGQDNEMPFDMEADIIEIDDDDYGLWYLDATDNGEKYDGKTVKIKGMVFKPEDMGKDVFVPGRFAMTCCADDMVFVGFICKYDKVETLNEKEWVSVTADIKHEFHPKYGEKGPVLYVTGVEKAEAPEEKIVYFS